MRANRLSVRLIHPYYNNNNSICQAFLRGRFYYTQKAVLQLSAERFFNAENTE
nr:MAG TPA: hypothetical protein [Caudoviricetes sp.]